MMAALNATALVFGWLLLLALGGVLAALAIDWAMRPQPEPQRPTFQPAPPPYSRERPRLAPEEFQAWMRWAVSKDNYPAPRERKP